MPIAFTRVTVHSRSQHRNAVESAAYRSASRLEDKATGQIFDYTKKQHVVYAQLMLPEGASDKFQDREILWNTVEQGEKRCDSQLCKDVMLALPKELDLQQHIELARRFAEDHFVSKGLVADVGIHHEEGNPHAHILVTLRRLVGERFAPYKARDLNPTFAKGGMIVGQDYWNIQWRDYQNQFFVEKGLDLVVDPDLLISQVHHGHRRTKQPPQQEKTILDAETTNTIFPFFPESELPSVDSPSIEPEVFEVPDTLTSYPLETPLNHPNPQSPLEISYRRETNQLRAKSAEFIALNDPLQVLNSLSKDFTVFSERDLVTLLNKSTNNAEDFQQALIKVKAHPELIHLGLGEDGRERYITRSAFEREMRLEKDAAMLAKRIEHGVSKSQVEQVIAKYVAQKKLNAEQAEAVRHVTSGGDIRLIVGRAGTGKTHTMKLVNEVYRDAGYRVLGISLSGVAAEGLQSGAKIPSYTLESFKYRLAKKTLSLTAKDVVVMDEASMTSLDDMNTVIALIKKVGAKFIAIGDTQQIQSIGAGAPFRTLLETLGFVELKHIVRQEEEWARETTALLAAGKTKEALDAYNQKGLITLEETTVLAQAALVDQWLVDLKKTTLPESILMAHRNSDVEALNILARERLIATGQLQSKDYELVLNGQKRSIRIGERILFLKNDSSLGVKNGHFGTVKEIIERDTQKTKLVVLLDNKQTIEVDTARYKDLTYGYAATIHKLQGVTRDFAYVLIGGYGYMRTLMYVALSRHRKQCVIMADKETHKSYEKLRQNVSSYGIKDALIDFPLRVAIRHGLDPEKLVDKVVRQLNKAKEAIPDKWQWLIKYQGRKAKFARLEQEKLIQETQTRRELAKHVAEYVDLNKTIAKGWAEHLSPLDAKEEGKATHTEDSKKFDHPRVKELNVLTLQRNQLAKLIYNEAHQLEAALDRHSLDVAMLMPHVKAYQCYETVQQYLKEVETGRIIHQHKLAALIQQDKKSYRPAIYQLLDKEKGQATSYAIWQESVIHRRRQAMTKLSSEERAAFKTIEAYRHCLQTLGKLYSEQIENGQGSLPTQQSALFIERERIAAIIHQDLSTHDAALRFYYPDPAKYAPMSIALQKAASRFAGQQRVQAYLKAKQAHQPLLQQRLAYLITQEPKAHGIAMANYQIDWQQVWQDTWAYQRRFQTKRSSLLDDYKQENIERYKAFSRETGRVWARIKAKETERETPTGKHLAKASQEKLRCEVLYAKMLLKQRNEAAYDLNKNKAAYAELIQKRKIDPEKLAIQAAAHQRLLDVKRYKIYDEHPARDRFAYDMKLNMKQYYGLLLENDVNLNTFYQDAHRHECRTILESLHPNVREAYQALDDYEQLRRQAGRAWQAVFKEGVNKDYDHPIVIEASALTKARNQAAAQALHLVYSSQETVLLEHFPIDNAMLEQAALAHQTWQTVSNYVAATDTNLKQNLAKNIIGDPQRFKGALCEFKVDRRALKRDAKAFHHDMSSTGHAPMIATHNETSSLPISPGMDEVDSAAYSNKKPNYEAKPRWNSKAIHEGLLANSEEFYRSILGEPKQQQGNTWRYGSKGSLVVNRQGQRAGLWYSHETGEGGGPLQLLMNSTYGSGLSYPDALEYGARIAGLTLDNQDAIIFRPKQNKTDAIINPIKDEQSRIKKAQYIASRGQSIHGTLGEHYLRKHRRIQGDLTYSGFKYIPATAKYPNPSLLVIARNAKQEITAVQTISLDPLTGNKAKNVKVVKCTHGVLKGSAALIQMGKSNQVIIAEGPETAASLIQAAPKAHIYVSLGNAANMAHMADIIRQHKTNKVLIAADNDGINAPSGKALEKAITALVKQGILVKVAKPDLLPGTSKTDFNDLLKSKGVNSVREVLNSAKLATKIVAEHANAANIAQLEVDYKQKLQREMVLKDEIQVVDTEIRLTKLSIQLQQAQKYGNFVEVNKTKMLLANEGKELTKNPWLKARLENQNPKLMKEIQEKYIDKDYDKER